MNDYGAVGDGVIFTDATITSGTVTLTSAATTFTSADIGKLIQIYGAGGSTAVSTTYFAGTGVSNMTFGGTYVGTSNLGYCVKITATANFSWGTYTKGNYSPGTACSNGSASVAMTGSAQTLSNGVTVTFPSSTGYTIGDVAVAGATTGVLATTIAGFTSAHVVTLTASATVTVASGGKGAYGTDNHTAIANGIAAVSAKSVPGLFTGGTLRFPKGIYLTNTQTLLAAPYVQLVGDGAGTQIVYAGSASIDGAVKLSPPTPGNCVSPLDSCLANVTLKDLNIRGNANSASALLTADAHQSQISNVNLSDAPNCMTVDVGYFNSYDTVTCSGSFADGTSTPGFLFIPITGIIFKGEAYGQVTTSSWTNTVIEGVLGVGLDLLSTRTLKFTGGVIQQSGIGVIAVSGSPDAEKNTWDTMDLESNIADLFLQGAYNVATNISSQDPVFIASSTNNSLMHGNYSNSITIAASAGGTHIEDLTYSGVFTDNGVNTVRINTCFYTSGNYTGCAATTNVFPNVLVIAPAQGTNDCLCALKKDVTVFTSGVLASVTVTPGTDTALPNSGTWTTTGGGGTLASGTFTASGGNLVSVTITNGGQRYTSNPTFVPSSGSIGTSTIAFSSCTNSAADDTSLTAFATTWVQPSTYWALNQAHQLDVAMIMQYTGAPTIPTTGFRLYMDAALMWENNSAITPVAHSSNLGFGLEWLVAVVPTGNVQVSLTNFGLQGSTSTTNLNPVANFYPGNISSLTTASHTISLQAQWSANTAGNALCIQNMVVR